MRTITNHEITDSLFLFLHSNEDGGALFQSQCTQILNSVSVKNNRFVNCECSSGEGPTGGAVECRTNSCPRFGNCLFSHCSAIDGGGALWLYGQYPSPLVSFSFFHDNTGSSTYGHDCCIRNGGQEEVFVSCFSTIQLTPRVYPFDYQDDWILYSR